MVLIYHVTTTEAADSIMAGGFEDRSVWAFSQRIVRGTFFCGWPAHDLAGAPNTSGRAVLAVVVPEDALKPYFIPDHNPAPMWIVPSEVANRYPVRLAESSEMPQVSDRYHEALTILPLSL